MADFLKINDQLINLQHLVRAQYWPAKVEREYFDEEREQTMVAPASIAELHLTLTETELENSFTYEGEINGTASVNVVVKVRGAAAEEAWEFLRLQSVQWRMSQQ